MKLALPQPLSDQNIRLVLLEQLWVKLDVAWLVHTVHIAEASSNGEVWRDRAQSLVDLVDVLWLGVQGVVVNILVVDTILLTTCDANLHLEPLLQRSRTLEVLGGSLDVEVDSFLRQVDHVRGEEGLAVLLEVGLIGIEHAVEPWKKLLGAMIGVEDDWDAVGGGNGTDVVGGGNSTLDGGKLVLVVNALAGEVGSTTLRGLQNDGSLCITSGFEGSDDSGGRGNVD